MKKIIFLSLLVISITADAQSLKDLLYNGKLKSDSNTVVKKTDDLSTKIDTTTKKKPTEPEKKIVVTAPMDSSSAAIINDADAPTPVTPKDNATITRDNTKLWKSYIDSFVVTLNTEVLNSKKIKKGDYFIMIDYEIGLDGLVNVKNVSPSPESSYLQEQIKERININPPRMNPVLDGNGKARKVNKKYNLNISKD